MASESNSQLVDTLITLGREKANVEIGQLLIGLDEGVLYRLVEEDLEVPGDDVSASPSFLATAFVFKGGCALIEKGRVQDGEAILGIAASACVSQICEDDPKDEKHSNGGQRWAVISDRLLEVLPQLSSRSVIDISFRILAELKTCGSTPNALQGFLPMLLDTLGAIGVVDIATNDGGREGFDGASLGASSSTISRTGRALKAYWVESACSYRWDPKASVAVCALLREIVLNERQLEVVANRMLRQLKLVELEELPAMVYQLLLFARNGFKREIVGGILGFFDTLEDDCSDNNRANIDGSLTGENDDGEVLYQRQQQQQQKRQKRWRELGDIEGTVMLHITYSIKQDFELGDALFDFAKKKGDATLTSGGGDSGPPGHTPLLPTFSFACMLSLARIHRFESAVTGFLRTTIVKSIHDAMALASTAWVRAYVPPIQLSAQQRLLSAVVARSSYGWDQVTQSLIQLCLGVMDYAGGSAAGSTATVRRGTSYSTAACVEARRICSQALRAAFREHRFVRSELVDQILNRVMFQEDAHLHFLDLLGELIADDPEGLRAYASKFIDVFDSISVISPAAIERLLVATAPIILEDAQFRSSLFLVLRKILFAHSLDDRRTALSGLFVLTARFAAALDECQRLQLLAAEGGSSSDGTIATTGDVSRRHVQRRIDVLTSALLEALGLLRRCLTQQPEVRAASYERLCLLLDMPCVRRNSLLLSALHDIFRVEFAKYYQSSGGSCSPINIQLCLHPATNKVVMPVASFLQCYAKLTIASSVVGSLVRRIPLNLGQESGPSSAAAASASVVAAGSWEDLCARFAQAQIEDFELDPTGDYSLDSQFGQRNFSTAHLVIGCLDACITYAISRCILAGGSASSSGGGGSQQMDTGDAPCRRSVDSPTIVVELFSKYSRFCDILVSRCLSEDRRKKVIGSVSDLSLMSLDSVLRVLRLVLPDKQRAGNDAHPLNEDPDADRRWYSSRAEMAVLWSANQSFVRHLLEVALARIQRRPSTISLGGGSNAGNSVVGAPPGMFAVLEMAYIVYSGVLSYYATQSNDSAADEERAADPVLPVYLRAKGAARGRSVVLLSAEILVACMSQLVSMGGCLDRLAVAVIQPTLERFAGPSQGPTADSNATECVALLLAALRRVVSALLRQRPVAARESAAVLSAVQLLTGRLAEVALAGDGERRQQSRQAAWRCLRQTAEWTVGLMGGAVPGDLGLMKCLLSQLTACQAFLRAPGEEEDNDAPMAALMRSGHRRPDKAELGPLSHLIERICATSRLHIREARARHGSADDDEDDEDEDGDVCEHDRQIFTLRAVAALVALIVAWLKAELHRVDWAIGQLRRSVQAEQSLAAQAHDGSHAVGSPDSGDLSASIDLERRICLRMCAMAHVLKQLLDGSLPQEQYDLVLRAFQDLHRSLALLTRAKLATPDLPITESYIAALSLICSELNTYAYALITAKYSNVTTSAAGGNTAEAKPMKDNGVKKAGKASSSLVKSSVKSKVKRDSSLISSLVYQMELSEKYVIQLSAKFKTPLAHYLKRSTARDFRINTRVPLPEPMIMGQEQEQEEQEPGEDEEEEDEDVAVSDAETEVIGDLVAGVDDDLPSYISSDNDDADGNQRSGKRMRHR